MKKVLLAFLFALPAAAQVSNPSIINVASAPSGACTQNLPDEQVVTLGTLYTCQSGTWTLIGSGGGGSFNALTGDATSTSTGGATTVKGLNGTLLSGLATGPLYNTTTTGAPFIGTPTPTSSIFYIASACNGLSNCLQWVDDDSTDNCGSATTAFMTAINSYAGPGEAHVYIEGSGSGKAYKLASCNLAFTGPAGTGGTAGSASIQSFATIDCAQTGGNCIQGGNTGCPTGGSFYSTGCHDFTWRGGTFTNGAGLGTAIFEIEPGLYIDVIDDVNFNNTGAGNATLGTCTNYSVQWDTWIGTSEFSRNKFQGNVSGQCFSRNVDQNGGANTLVFTSNTIEHTTPALSFGPCGGILHSDSSMHTSIGNNTLYGFAVVLDFYKAAAAGAEGGWIATGNSLDTGGCTVSGGVSASVQFGLPSNNGAVGPVTLSNNNGYTSPLIAEYPGSSAAMQGWSATGNNTTQGSSFLIGGSSTGCLSFNGIPCYIGANPGYPTTGSGGVAYTGFTVLGSAGGLTWPPSAATPVFSPVAGVVSPGTTVTTSCSTGSPFISTGTTAVAGGTGIVVSSTETLYGSCQGSGYFVQSTPQNYLTNSFTIPNTGLLNGGATSVTSAALTAFSAALTSGSLIIVHEFSGSNVTYTVPTDTAGNTYVDCGPGQAAFTVANDQSECFYALNTHTTASNVVTVHSSTGATFLSGLAFEVVGAASSSPIDGGSGVGYSIKASAFGGAAGANNLTATSLTPVTNGDLIVAFFATGSNGNTAGTAPNAFTLVNGTFSKVSEYFNQGTAAAIIATASDSTSTDPYAAIVIAVKP